MADHDHLRRGRSLPGALRQLRLAHDDIRPLRDRVDRTVGNTHAADERFDAFAETVAPMALDPMPASQAKTTVRIGPSSARGATARSSDNRSVRLLNGLHLLQMRTFDDRRRNEERHGCRDHHPGEHQQRLPLRAPSPATAMMLPGDATAVSPVPVSE